jgi:hypothetical protein
VEEYLTKQTELCICQLQQKAFDSETELLKNVQIVVNSIINEKENNVNFDV